MSQTDIKKSRSKRLQTAKRRRNQLLVVNLVVYALLIFVFIIAAKNLKSDKKALRSEGIILYEQGDYKAAAAKFDEALEEKQWFAGKLNADIALYKASSLAKAEDYAGASMAYNAVLKYNYKSFMDKSRVEELVLIYHELFAFEHENYDGLNEFLKCVDNGNTEFAIFAALCYEKKGDLENMKKYLDIYATKYSLNSFCFYQYAVYHIKKGEIDIAKSYIDTGLQTADDSYKKQLEYLQIAALRNDKDYKEAYRLAKEYTSKYPDDEEGRLMYEFLDTRVNADPAPLNNIYSLYYDEDYVDVYGKENSDTESSDTENSDTESSDNDSSADEGYEYDYSEESWDEDYSEYSDDYYEEE